VFSPAVSGKPTSMLKGVDFHWFPLDNPGIVAIPLSFLLGVVGTWVGGRRPADGGVDGRVADALHAAMEVRALTGAGAERPTP
jgi:cation/acetate symporter